MFSLHRLFDLFAKKKSGYRRGVVRPHQFSASIGSFGMQRNRVARIKHWLSNRENQSHQGYRSATNRSKIRSKIGWMIFCSCILCLFVGLDGFTRIQSKLLSINLFQIDSIRITGNIIVSNEKIREASGIIIHQTSMLGIRTSVLEEKLAAVPWIARAVVGRNWPSGIEIEIKENIPLALLDKGASSEPQLYYIDKYGVSFLPVSPGGKVDLPVITGLPAIEDPFVKQKGLAEALKFLQKVRRNDPHLPAHSVSEVHVNSEGKLVVYLVEYPFPIFFGSGETNLKYMRLVQVLKALYKKEKGENLISKIEYIQMDYLQDKVLVAQTGSG